MSVKWTKVGWPVKVALYDKWAKNHRTIIILNGGNSAMLKDAMKFFESLEANYEKDMPYPIASFCEDEQSLNGAMTAVGIILPESVYTGKSQKIVDLAIYNFISKFKLA